MRIGVDLDNTLINYDGIFYHAAQERNLISNLKETSKSAVKSYIQQHYSDDCWTELQGIVYGETIQYAKAYENAVNVLQHWVDLGYELFLVSHKTKFPIIGEKLDFHDAAIRWMDINGVTPFFSNIHFCATKDDKVTQINELELDVFIDDLPSVLLHLQFPDETTRILFGSQHCDADLNPSSSWLEVAKIVQLNVI